MRARFSHYRLFFCQSFWWQPFCIEFKHFLSSVIKIYCKRTTRATHSIRYVSTTYHSFSTNSYPISAISSISSVSYKLRKWGNCKIHNCSPSFLLFNQLLHLFFQQLQKHRQKRVPRSCDTHLCKKATCYYPNTFVQLAGPTRLPSKILDIP